jgi:inhibitor of KinA sporulation pathway (predicted exonuclease)
MAEIQAKVSSIDAIEQFRSALIVFISKARPTLEEIASEVTRTKQWLQNDQRSYWEQQLKVRARELERAQAELFTARLSKIQQVSAAQQMAVQRAHRGIREAEEKARVLKKWSRDLENRSEPMVKEIEQLHGYLTTDMGRAVAYLNEIVKSLQAYAETRSSGLPSPLPAPTEEPPAASSTETEPQIPNP